MRFTLLALAVLWSLRLVWRLLARRPAGLARRGLAWLAAAAGLAPFCLSWVLFFAIW
ncbi:regulatory protein [Bordetella pertussis]|nr:regulatory protein [Bordetella pertussis]